MEAGGGHVATPEHCLRQLKKAVVVVSWPWPPSDISAWKQESPVGSAFRGGPGGGEFPVKGIEWHGPRFMGERAESFLCQCSLSG